MRFDFTDLLDRFTSAVEAADGNALAGLFTANGSYDDTFYGTFHGHDAIADMLENRFWGDAEAFQWDMYEPVFDNTLNLGYARWVFSYSSTMDDSRGRRVVFNGMSQFSLSNGLIVTYREVFSAGLALTQLDMDPARVDTILRRLVEKHKNDPEWGRHIDFRGSPGL
ncbi:MAG: nuclear transport factor 2 family protein [Rhodospirillaceae bacterium]|nr:nuclear transport factor 2 family protein [Rhodospirillaceae bacterium]